MRLIVIQSVDVTDSVTDSVVTFELELLIMNFFLVGRHT